MNVVNQPALAPPWPWRGAFLAAFPLAAAACSGAGDAQEGAGIELPLTASHLTVNLQTYSGNYLVADNGGGAALMAYSTSAQDWETFTLADLNGAPLNDGDIVALQGGQGQWVVAHNGGGGAITVTAPSARGWEQFRAVKMNGSGAIGDGDTLALQAKAGGQYVSAIDGGGGDVLVNAPTPQEWETLTLRVVGGGGGPGGGGGGNGATELSPYHTSYSDLVALRKKIGLESVTLAFVLQGTGCSTDQDILSDVSEIQAFQAAGGHVKASFGGQTGQYVEYGCGSAGSLAKAITSFVDQSGIVDLDFDIEQTKAYPLSTMRGQALKMVQDSRGIQVSFTLSVSSKGLDPDSVTVLKGALDAGVAVSHVNVMTMDYWEAGKGQTLGPIAIETLRNVNGELQSMMGVSESQAYAVLGATAMIGLNDSGEMFSLDDAAQLVQFARANGLGLLSYWSLNRDTVCNNGLDWCSTVNQGDFDFYNVFKTVRQ
jgi:hypothetical protein